MLRLERDVVCLLSAATPVACRLRAAHRHQNVHVELHGTLRMARRAAGMTAQRRAMQHLQRRGGWLWSYIALAAKVRRGNTAASVAGVLDVVGTG